MLNSRLIRLLLLPSFLSTIAAIVGAIGILVVGNWSYLTSRPELYDFFYGDQGLLTVFEGSPKLVSDIQYNLFDSKTAYIIETLFVALLAAVVVFMTLRIVERFIHVLRIMGSSMTTHEERHELIQSTLLHTLIGVLWLIYMLLSVVVGIPFCLLLARIGIEATDAATEFGTNVAAFGTLVLGLHAHIIFARMLRGRPRLFGGDAAINDSLMEHEAGL